MVYTGTGTTRALSTSPLVSPSEPQPQVPVAPQTGLVSAATQDTVPTPAFDTSMPPPPPLPHHKPNPAVNNINLEDQPQPKARRAAKRAREESAEPVLGGLAHDLPNAAEIAAPQVPAKRRGRPAGSKNKKQKRA